MKYVFAFLFVFSVACPALARELMTRDETSVYEQPDRKSKVLAKIAQNVKVTSEKRKDLWFHVSTTVDGKKLLGWVNQADVDTMMGRSKGQLLAQNKRLYEELTALRETAKVQREELKTAAKENADLRQKLKKVRAELEEAKNQLRRLNAAGQKARTLSNRQGHPDD